MYQGHRCIIAMGRNKWSYDAMLLFLMVSGRAIINNWSVGRYICLCFSVGLEVRRLCISYYLKSSVSWYKNTFSYLGPIKRICVFEHSVMTNFNCVGPAVQRSQGSGFLSEGSSWLTARMSEQRRFWWDCADAQTRLNLRCSHRR